MSIMSVSISLLQDIKKMLESLGFSVEIQSGYGRTMLGEGRGVVVGTKPRR